MKNMLRHLFYIKDCLDKAYELMPACQYEVLRNILDAQDKCEYLMKKIEETKETEK